jgi:hypothetical protein
LKRRSQRASPAALFLATRSRHKQPPLEHARYIHRFSAAAAQQNSGEAVQQNVQPLRSSLRSSADIAPVESAFSCPRAYQPAAIRPLGGFGTAPHATSSLSASRTSSWPFLVYAPAAGTPRAIPLGAATRWLGEAELAWRRHWPGSGCRRAVDRGLLDLPYLLRGPKSDAVIALC